MTHDHRKGPRMADLTTDVALLAPDEHDTLHVLLLRRSQTSDAAAGFGRPTGDRMSRVDTA